VTTIVIDRDLKSAVLSEEGRNELERAERNAEYLEKIDRSFRQLEEGRVVIKTMEELEEMAK
jgi:antitoxin YefM